MMHKVVVLRGLFYKQLKANHSTILHVKLFDRGHKICLLPLSKIPTRISPAHKK
jgi:hypothetical protein